MNNTNVIRAVINATKYTVTAPIIKEDYGLYLLIEGADLPPVYEVDFSNEETSGSSVTMIGNSDGVLIPRQFIKSGRDVFAFLYLTGEDYGRTVYKFRIPNKLRPDRTDAAPDPEEQSIIEQAIAALNGAVEQTAADVVTTTAKAAEATAAAQTATQKAAEAAESAEGVETYALRAEVAQRAAETARDTATAKATAAATSAENASLSAVNALDSAADANISAGQASASASAAGQSALDARDYKDAANLSAESASGYAGAASESAESALASAETATAKASEAAQSATDASTAKDDAVTAKVAAQTAQTAAETAQAASETAAATLENILPTDTATGSIASFPDGSNLFPAKSVVIGINPVQDLHGYNVPWPAGGSSNQWDEEWESGTLDASGTPIAKAETIRSKNYNACLGNTDYCFLKPAGLYMGYQFYDANKTLLARNSFRSSATSVVTTPADARYFKIMLGDESLAVTTYGNNAAVNYPSSVTTYSPYSNICPITGWTGANVKRTEKNLWDNALFNVGGFMELVTDTTSPIYGYYNGSVRKWSDANNNLYLGKGAERVTVSFDAMSYHETGQFVFRIVFNYSDGTSGHDGNHYAQPMTKTHITSTSTSGKTVVSVSISTTAGVNNLQGCLKNVQVEIGASETTYEEPTITLYPISWQSTAGTVYGGTLDVVTGELVVDRAETTISDLTWSYDSTYQRFETSSLKNIIKKAISSAVALEGLISSAYTTRAATKTGSSPINGTIAATNLGVVLIRDEAYTSVNDLVAGVGSQTIVYPLATPTTYHLTPTEVSILLGQNNVWADTGDTEVTYKADVQKWVEKKLT